MVSSIFSLNSHSMQSDECVLDIFFLLQLQIVRIFFIGTMQQWIELSLLLVQSDQKPIWESGPEVPDGGYLHSLSSLYVSVSSLSRWSLGHDCIQTVASLWLSFRITRSSNGQKWRRWTLQAGCAKQWAWTSPALPLAAPNEEAPTALAYTGNTQHLTHTQAITHIGTLHLLLGAKKIQKKTVFPCFIYLFTSSSDP